MSHIITLQHVKNCSHWFFTLKIVHVHVTRALKSLFSANFPLFKFNIKEDFKRWGGLPFFHWFDSTDWKNQYSQNEHFAQVYIFAYMFPHILTKKFFLMPLIISNFLLQKRHQEFINLHNSKFRGLSLLDFQFSFVLGLKCNFFYN